MYTPHSILSSLHRQILFGPHTQFPNSCFSVSIVWSVEIPPNLVVVMMMVVVVVVIFSNIVCVFTKSQTLF